MQLEWSVEWNGVMWSLIDCEVVWDVLWSEVWIGVEFWSAVVWSRME